MARRRPRPTDPETRYRNMLEASGLPALAGLSRIGFGSGGSSALALPASVLADPTSADTQSHGQLLVMSATADSIASGGDTVIFDTIEAQQDFHTVPVAGASWVHPITGVYTLTYEHSWDTYTAGGSVQLLVDSVAAAATIIGAGSSGATGRGTIHYFATSGSIGAIQVTQSSGSPQTCDATVWVAITDPVSAIQNNDNIQLFYDGVLVYSDSGTVAPNFAQQVTVLFGIPEVSPGAASDYTYDNVQLTQLTVNQLSNSGIESAISGTGTSSPVNTGNWRVTKPSGSTATVDRTGTRPQAGSFAADVISAGGANQGGFFYQDLTLTSGDFWLDFWIYPDAGQQTMEILFNWDRGTAGTASGVASLVMDSTDTNVSVFGNSGTAPALDQDNWTHVLLKIGLA